MAKQKRLQFRTVIINYRKTQTKVNYCSSIPPCPLCSQEGSVVTVADSTQPRASNPMDVSQIFFFCLSFFWWRTISSLSSQSKSIQSSSSHHQHTLLESLNHFYYHKRWKLKVEKQFNNHFHLYCEHKLHQCGAMTHFWVPSEGKQQMAML